MADANHFVDTLLLIALPASGKSEVRKFLMHMDKERRIRDFHLSDTVQLDDYPYVEFMREVDDALAESNLPGAFFDGPQGRFVFAGDWGSLLHLVNDDWAVMMDPSLPTPVADPRALCARLDAARQKVGGPTVFAGMNDSLMATLADRLQAKTEWVYNELFGHRPDSMEGKTLVIEFARGGPQGSPMPLDPPHGYAWNLAQLRPEILARAAALYIWVTPEESRRKNAARAVPGETNTVIFHAAPETVMVNDYGCDDINWLLAQQTLPNTLPIEAHGQVFNLPFGRFDNRTDKTTMLRDDPTTWDAEAVETLQVTVAKATGDLWSAVLART